MKRTVVENLYIIFNLAAHKQYVGRTRNLHSRYSDHVSKLRAGRHENPDLQRDWDRDGEESFIWVDVLLRAGQMRLNVLEDLFIDTLRSTDPTPGYNRMTSRGWSSHARLRDLERKLIRRGKFKLIPGIKLGDPIAEIYLESVWKGHGKKNRERPEWDAPEEQWDAPKEQEQNGEALEGPARTEEAEDELRDGEEGEEASRFPTGFRLGTDCVLEVGSPRTSRWTASACSEIFSRSVLGLLIQGEHGKSANPPVHSFGFKLDPVDLASRDPRLI